MADNKLPQRKSIRLKGYDYSQPGAYFVTIVTQNRENLFGEIVDDKMILNEYGKIVDKFWHSLPEKYQNIELDEFIVMPNHIHGIIIINERVIRELPQRESPKRENDIKNRRKMILPKIIGYFKMNTAKQINILRKTLGLPVWQRNYYEHIVRNEDELNRIREYIINNPLKWNLDKENN